MIPNMPFRSSYNKLILFIVLCNINSTGFASSCDSLSVNGADGWYPYFARQNPNRLGIMGDIVSRAAERSGLEINLKPSIPWKRILFNLRYGNLDVIAGALKTQQREKQFLFSTPVHYAELRVFVRKDRRFDYSHISDLKGKHGAKVRGMSLGQAADDYAFNNLVIDDAPSPKNVFQMVASGRLDYGVFYWTTGLIEVERNNLTAIVEALPNAVSKEGLYIAYSKNSHCQDEIAQLNDEINRMKNDGSIEAIIQYYHSAVAAQEMEQSNGR